jgi:hypothetical protein
MIYISSVTQELQLHRMSTSMELTKAVTDKDVLQAECDQLRLEQDEAGQRTERVKQLVQGVYNVIS